MTPELYPAPHGHYGDTPPAHTATSWPPLSLRRVLRWQRPTPGGPQGRGSHGSCKWRRGYWDRECRGLCPCAGSRGGGTGFRQAQLGPPRFLTTQGEEGPGQEPHAAHPARKEATELPTLTHTQKPTGPLCQPPPPPFPNLHPTGLQTWTSPSLPLPSDWKGHSESLPRPVSGPASQHPSLSHNRTSPPSLGASPDPRSQEECFC